MFHCLRVSYTFEYEKISDRLCLGVLVIFNWLAWLGWVCLDEAITQFIISEGYREGYPYDVTVSRLENEGFGFVIISSVSRAGSTIGRIIPGWLVSFAANITTSKYRN